MKGLFNLYLLLIALILLALSWLIYRKQWQNLIRPPKFYAQFSGVPQYIAGSSSGSPLSDFGSHCGFKAVPENRAAACSALFATLASFGAGRIYDFAACLYSEDGQTYFKKPQSRKVHFKPYCIEEQAVDEDFELCSRLYFLQHNLAVLDTEWTAREKGAIVIPACCFLPTGGRDLENPYPHFNGFSFMRAVNRGLKLTDYYRVPWQKLHVYFLPGEGKSAGGKELQGIPVALKPGQSLKWAVLISFSADSEEEAIESAEKALGNLESLKKGAEKHWAAFEEALPETAVDEGRPAREVLNLAAWGLHSNLYYPRGNMKRWGSVPSKVYFPFFWGWDTPQHVMGLSEWDPKIAGDILLTQLRSNYWAPEKARFKIKIKGISILTGSERSQIPSKVSDSLRGVLNFYSQPPLQSWAGLRAYQRLRKEDEQKEFLRQLLPPLCENIRWWEANRQLHSGFFSYINGLESGLDDSPRFYPPSFLPSFVIGLVPRFFAAVDLNCWLFQSYINTAYLCREAGLENDAALYQKQADELKVAIDEKLWSTEHGAWLDRRNNKFIEVFTPSIWWPAFVGAVKDLQKVRTVVEKHLLRPEKFWGSYGIPSVSFDDSSYNKRKDGYYWRGQIWMINNYTALEVLFRFGYSRAADELRKRVVETIYSSMGLYETYNAATGQMGWSSRGPGDPAVMQFGMTSAWAIQIILSRHEHFCYLFPETIKLSGHIKWAAAFECEPATSPPGIEKKRPEAVFWVDGLENGNYAVPRVCLESCDGKPLLHSSQVKIKFENPYGFEYPDRVISFSWQGYSLKAVIGISYFLNPQNRAEIICPAPE